MGTRVWVQGESDRDTAGGEDEGRPREWEIRVVRGKAGAKGDWVRKACKLLWMPSALLLVAMLVLLVELGISAGWGERLVVGLILAAWIGIMGWVGWGVAEYLGWFD